MKFTFTTAIHKEGKWFVAQCVELGVASQGLTVSGAKNNLNEAIELYIEE
jgi:predicted RNase H-like HicB family nuclease